jgi:hypothetical protein
MWDCPECGCQAIAASIGVCPMCGAAKPDVPVGTPADDPAPTDDSAGGSSTPPAPGNKKGKEKTDADS